MTKYDRDTTFSMGTVTGNLAGAETGPRVSLLLYHRDGAQMVPLTPGQAVVVGRARPSDVPMRDHSLSRQHARFELVNDELWVEDLGSTNGTRLNGKRVQRSRVREKDEVQMGAVTAVLHVLRPEEDAPPEGLDSHDHFMDKLEQEVVRGRTFGRSLALLMVRAAKRKQAQIGRWGLHLRSLVRPVDHVALYDQASVLIALVESSLSEAQALADSIISGRSRRDPQLLVGVAVYPESAASAEGLVEAVRRACEEATSRRPVSLAGIDGAAGREISADDPVVVSEQVRELFQTARRVADAQIPVLIIGETGAGKEVVARYIHDKGGRKKGPLRCINCASIPEQLVESALFGHERGAFTGADREAKGLFEEAQGGTVLLDEIGELSPAAQASLLRVIETRTITRVGSSKERDVDVRILAATHRDLEQMCEGNQFRWDLYYRLSTMVLRIPPLRDRPEEVMPLAEHFMRAACRANGCKVTHIDAEAARLLQAYNWPGNVRELRNVIDRAVVIAQDATIVVDDLSERVRRGPGGGTDAQRTTLADVPAVEPGVPIKEQLKRYEAQLLLDALEQNDWNQTRTAEALGMPLRTLVHKIRTHGLKKRYERG